MKKKTALTIDGLALMMQRQFAEADKKADGRFSLILERFSGVESDIKDIKTTLRPLVRSVL